MKLFWLHDFRLKEWLGGAQLTNEQMLSKAPIEVEMIYPDVFDRKKIAGYPLILSNTGLFKKEDLRWIIETQKYIKYERDYAFCKNRHAAGHDCSEVCVDTLAFYTKMFQNSILNIFLSPLHAEVYLKYMPLDEGKIYYQPSPIEVDKFRYEGEKEELYISVGRDAWHKGTDLIKRKFRKKNFVFLGKDNWVPYDEIPDWYKRAKYFVHKPRWIEPFGRTVAEAYCASCVLIVNYKIGFLSYNWDYDDRPFVFDQLVNSPDRFWGKVLECLE